ncbi:hypothetical protein [Actinoplanes sp. NPDC051494]|uniref:hypothetical protein n=1 Tax=Actinoplanes sp. NPDC051494 TaxID=3363907 RepID=UPI0037983899
MPGSSGPVTEKVEAAGTAAAGVAGRLGLALENAIVQGDSRGDLGQAAKILDGALRRALASRDETAAPESRVGAGVEADAVTLVEALVYRAEIALGMDDPAKAASVLGEARSVALTPQERVRAADTLRAADELM